LERGGERCGARVISRMYLGFDSVGALALAVKFFKRHIV
jgi:hypothetical protein